MYRIQNWRLNILLNRTDLTPPILNSVRLSLFVSLRDFFCRCVQSRWNVLLRHSFLERPQISVAAHECDFAKGQRVIELASAQPTEVVRYVVELCHERY